MSCGKWINKQSGFEVANRDLKARKYQRLADSDNDGMTGGQEVQAGTSPANALDRLVIVAFAASTNQHIIKWTSKSGKQHDNICSTQPPLDSYTTIADGICATAPTNTVTGISTNAVPFYRVRLKQ